MDNKNSIIKEYMRREVFKDNPNKMGKWIIFSKPNGNNLKEFLKLRLEAVMEDVADDMKIGEPTAKYNHYVYVFYCNYDDIERHKKIIKFMMKNNLIQKTKTGRYYNISYKLEDQTQRREYGDNFIPILKLENFIDLYTGKFIV